MNDRCSYRIDISWYKSYNINDRNQITRGRDTRRTKTVIRSRLRDVFTSIQKMWEVYDARKLSYEMGTTVKEMLEKVKHDYHGDDLKPRIGKTNIYLNDIAEYRTMAAYCLFEAILNSKLILAYSDISRRWLVLNMLMSPPLSRRKIMEENGHHLDWGLLAERAGSIDTCDLEMSDSKFGLTEIKCFGANSKRTKNYKEDTDIKFEQNFYAKIEKGEIILEQGA